MSKLRVLSIFGTRPEAVKMAPVVQMLSRSEGIESKVCVTAQHRQMLDQVLNLFDIAPDYDLNLMRPNQSLSDLSAAVFSHLDPILVDFKPDWVLVQGDTTTVMCSALAAYHRQIRVGHVEAGLRTNDKWQPFPEEINRRVAGVVADLHFAPTQTSRANLRRENVPDAQIVVTGNPAVDALQQIIRQPAPPEVQTLLQRIDIHPDRAALQAKGRRLALVTAHRRENFGQPLENICLALRCLAQDYQGELQIVYPVHLNPNVQETAHRVLSQVENVTLLDPLDYLPMVHLMKAAAIILTDSGGIQEEATALRIPALVLRDVTERPEGVEAGVLKLVGTETERIVSEAKTLLDSPAAYQAMASAQNPFGDGHAAEQIVAALLAQPK